MHWTLMETELNSAFLPVQPQRCWMERCPELEMEYWTEAGDV